MAAGRDRHRELAASFGPRPESSLSFAWFRCTCGTVPQAALTQALQADRGFRLKATWPKPHAAEAAETLRTAAARRGIFVGAAANENVLESGQDPLYATTLAAQYSLLTAENR